ncbi:MAG TPA: nucleoside monophosphate kinase [Actinomycetota bacterium]|nr:nucleoside monophosphate kinase [Actinomycetota bacterium]
MRIVMLGPPASGKGTQGIRLADEFGVPHVSSGHLLRESMEAGDPLGIGDIVTRGELVPDELVQQLLTSALGEGFVLDGYPRTAAQAEWLDRELARRGLPLDAAVEIAVDEDALVERMERRAELEGRPDDVPEAFARRLAEYGGEAPALRAYYGDHLVAVDGVGAPDEVYDRLLAALRDRGISPSRA